MRCVDLFAGAGGFSEGARQAGAKILWAGNHWPAAVEYHTINHPETAHACQDLQQADWAQVPAHDLLLASPSCQGFTKARGKDRPRHDAARSTAWAVISCAEYHRPPVVVVENVPEFQQWVLFPAWAQALQALGYSLSMHVLDSADFEVPQNRLRLFIVATRSKAGLVLGFEKKPHKSAQIDWGAGKWSPIDKPGRSASTLQRIKNGRAQFGGRFLLPYYSSALTGRCPSRPIGTITTIERYAAVDGQKMRMLTVDEYRRAMGFPAGYVLPEKKRLAVHLLGNAVCPPVARDLIEKIRAYG